MRKKQASGLRVLLPWLWTSFYSTLLLCPLIIMKNFKPKRPKSSSSKITSVNSFLYGKAGWATTDVGEHRDPCKGYTPAPLRTWAAWRAEQRSPRRDPPGRSTELSPGSPQSQAPPWKHSPHPHCWFSLVTRTHATDRPCVNRPFLSQGVSHLSGPMALLRTKEGV